MDAVTELTKEMSQEEILREAIARGTIDMNEISASVNELKRKDALSQHPRDIWQNDKGEFLTYIYDEEGKRKIRRRKTREELEDFLARYYSDKETQIYLEDIFTAWSSEKLKYGEIQKQSYDRYSNDYRHSTHKIRKTYGTALLDGDVDESFVAEQMGHKDVNTTRKLYYYSNKREKTKIDQIANAISF